MKFNRIIALLTLVTISSISSIALADRRVGTVDFTFLIPHVFDQSYTNEGEATLETRSSTGFGVGFGYHQSENLTFTGDITWNSIKYDAERVILDPDPVTDAYSGKLDTWALRGGVDYYFTNGRLSPFVNGNIGWSFVDTNIPSGPPGQICWWDPWWGYVCSWFQNTYKEDSFMYGLGAGLRLEIGRSNFAKLGYYNQWLGYDNGAGSSSMDEIRFEFGFSF